MLRKLLFLIVIMSSINLSAQNNVSGTISSPYSFYGIGDLSSDNTYHVQQMAGIGNSYSDTYTLNLANPASYASLARTSFDVGMWAQNSTFKDSENRVNLWDGNLGYLALGFPLINPLNKILERNESPWTLGAAFAIKPLSRVSYNITSVDSTSIPGSTFVRNFKGNGGLNEFVFGASAKYKQLSFGVNAKYQFGSIQKSDNQIFTNVEYPYNNIFSTEYSNKGFSYDFGVMYDIALNKYDPNSSDKRKKRKRLQLGGTVGIGGSIKSDYVQNKALIQSIGGVTSIDTLSTIKDDFTGKMPFKYGMGATYFHGDNLAVGVDYTNALWSKYNNGANQIKEGDLNDSYKVSLGGYYRPSLRAYSKFFQRVQYKFGVVYEKDYRKVNNSSVNRQAVTFGFGLPFVYKRKFSQGNLGFEIGKIGKGTLVEQNYFKLTFGFSFGDNQWFVKRKYN